MTAVALSNRRRQPVERPALFAALGAPRRRMRAACVLAVLLVLAAAMPAGAQTATRQAAPRPSSPPASGRLLEIAGFVHGGSLSLAATRSFDAILGTSSGTVIGGGGEVTFRRGPLRGLFARVDVSRFEETGERVFVFNGEVFPLGIPETITLTPVEFSGGVRWLRMGKRRAGQAAQPFWLVPYAGLGAGSMGYRETGAFAASGDAVDERFTSYHAFGGADVRVWKGISAGVEAVYRWVPDALGGSGVSEAFNESNLDGATVRVRIRAAF